VGGMPIFIFRSNFQVFFPDKTNDTAKKYTTAIFFLFMPKFYYKIAKILYFIFLFFLI